MNKKLLYSLIASVSMASTGAYAATGSSVTTKAYVDAGLQYVYDVANGTETGTVQNLKTIVGAPASNEDPATGLIGDVSALQGTIGNTAMGTNAGTVTGAISELHTTVSELQSASKTYEGGDGIAVVAGESAGDPYTIGFELPTNQNDEVEPGAYIYTVGANGGEWQPLEMATTWNPGVLH